jgi:hypothetical protein
MIAAASAAVAVERVGTACTMPDRRSTWFWIMSKPAAASSAARRSSPPRSSRLAAMAMAAGGGARVGSSAPLRGSGSRSGGSQQPDGRVSRPVPGGCDGVHRPHAGVERLGARTPSGLHCGPGGRRGRPRRGSRVCKCEALPPCPQPGPSSLTRGQRPLRVGKERMRRLSGGGGRSKARGLRDAAGRVEARACPRAGDRGRDQEFARFRNSRASGIRNSTPRCVRSLTTSSGR